MRSLVGCLSVPARHQGVTGPHRGASVVASSAQRMPLVSAALVEHLERIFSDSLPNDATESIDSVRFRSGSVHVVKHLRALYDRQQRDPFTTAVAES